MYTYQGSADVHFLVSVTAEYPILSSSEVFFCLKLKISITKKPIGLLILERLYIGTVMVLGHSIFEFKSLTHLNGFKLFF